MNRAPGTNVDSIAKRLLLPLGDTLALILFATMGRASHAEGLDVVGVAETAAPFVLGWILAGTFTGAYREDATDTPRSAAVVTARTWIVGIPVGLLLRMLYLRRGVPVSFAIVTMLTTLALLGLWRVGLAALRRQE